MPGPPPSSATEVAVKNATAEGRRILGVGRIVHSFNASNGRTDERKWLLHTVRLSAKERGGERGGQFEQLPDTTCAAMEGHPRSPTHAD